MDSNHNNVSMLNVPVGKRFDVHVKFLEPSSLTKPRPDTSYKDLLPFSSMTDLWPFFTSLLHTLHQVIPRSP